MLSDSERQLYEIIATDINLHALIQYHYNEKQQVLEKKGFWNVFQPIGIIPVVPETYKLEEFLLYIEKKTNSKSIKNVSYSWQDIFYYQYK